MSYIFYWPVGKTFSETEAMLVWVKTNCPSYITNDIGSRNDIWYYGLYFGDEKDYILTLLRWS